jgi:hypothetical protein
MFDSSTPTRGGGAGFDFNPSLVQVLGITEGDYYSGAGLATYFSPGTIDNVAGTVRNLPVRPPTIIPPEPPASECSLPSRCRR